MDNSVKSPFGNIYLNRYDFSAEQHIRCKRLHHPNVIPQRKVLGLTPVATIEIVWGSLMRSICPSGKQYDTCDQLKFDICNTWLILVIRYI